MVWFEKNGIPTVNLSAERFLNNAQTSARAFGYKSALIPTVSFPHGFTNFSPEAVHQLIDERIDAIIRGLLEEPQKPEVTKKETEMLLFQGTDRLEAWREMNKVFLGRGWGDGFPIVPAEAEKVREMIEHSKRNRDEVIRVLGPGNGLATVEKIAINTVMAGCLPEHLPVLIAAVEAIVDPKFNLRGVATSTGPHTPMLIINGPIAKELKINCGQAALGPGAQSFANTVIGRALRLILMNVGHAYAGKLDMDTIGSPNKYSMVLAENEELSPWEALHVERGFGKETSTVTAFPVESQLEIANATSYRAEHILNTFASAAANAGSPTAAGEWIKEGRRNRDNLVMLCPDHSKIIGDQGWTKTDVREYLYFHARIPWLYWKYGSVSGVERARPGWKWLYESASDDLLLPVTAGSDHFHIIVVGGQGGGKSSYITGIGQPVTREIKRL